MFKLLLEFILYSLFLSNIGGSQCPDVEPCTCTDTESLLLIDCSNINMSHNPNILNIRQKSIKGLFLRNVSVNSLPPQNFKDSEVEILDLSENRFDNLDRVLREISPCVKEIYLNRASVNPLLVLALQRFVNLTTLSLVGNDLDFQKIPADIFKNISELRHLDLSKNNFRHSKEFQGLQGLDNLKVLKLRSTNLDLKNGLNFLKSFNSLTELYLDDNGNEVYPIIGSSFEILNLHSLKKLSLQSSQIVKLHDATFKTMADLEILDLSNNSLLMVPYAVTSKLLNLTHLNVSNNNIHYIGDRTFENLTKLQYLNLHSNELESFPTNAFRGLGNSLRSLDLSCNKLNGGYFWVSGLRPLHSILKLNISFNRLQHVQNDSFDSTAYLEELDLSGNPLRFTDTMFSGIEYSLKKLYMKNIGIKHVPLNPLQTINNLDILDLSYNKIVKLDRMFLKGVNTSAIFLQSMKISNISSDAFMGIERPMSVYLDKNNITSLSFIKTLTPCFFRSVSMFDNPLICDCTALSISISGKIGNVTGTCSNEEFRNLSLYNLALHYNKLTRLCDQADISTGRCSKTGKFISNSVHIFYGNQTVLMIIIYGLLVKLIS